MFFNKLYVLKGVFKSAHDFAKDLYEYMQEDGVPVCMLDIKSQADLHSAIGNLRDEENIALHLDLHGSTKCIQFDNEYTESWEDVASLMNVLDCSTNIRVMTLNVCYGASLVDKLMLNQTCLDYIIASNEKVTVSEGCSRCHLFYNELYKSGNVLTAWQKFNDQSIKNKSNFHLYKEDKEVPLDKL